MSKDVEGKKIWTAITASWVYLGIFILARVLEFGIEVVGRPWYGPPPMLPTLGIVLKVALIGMTAFVLAKPLVPKWVKLTTSKPTFYIQNQWRIAQIALSIGLAGIVGASIPFVLEFSRRFGPMALVLTLGLTVIPLLSISLFYVLRLHFIEKEHREPHQ